MAPAPVSTPPIAADGETGFGRRQRMGAALAAAVFAALWLAPPLVGLSGPGTRVALLALLMAVLWVSELIPIAAMALLPLILSPLLGLSSIRQAAAPYADPIIFFSWAGSCWPSRRSAGTCTGVWRWASSPPSAPSPAPSCWASFARGAFISLWTSNPATATMGTLGRWVFRV